MEERLPFFLYNTLSKTKEELRQLRKEAVSLYTCGPTVYHFVHIGNLRAFTFYDVLERALRHTGYPVERVMNITDVGHLTSDADEGEDKMDKAIKRERKSVEDIINFYTESFLADAQMLNIIIPEKLPRASAYIPQQIDLIQKLFDKGFAYDTPEAVYFNTSKFPGYGKLTGQSLDEKTLGAREEVVTETSKLHPVDFALWFKQVGRFREHAQHWPSPWGEGFPGWHLECSALIKTLLGQPIDLHAGGVDHIGTHHTNEIAQSEAAYEVPLANTWLHVEFLLVDKKKMAKSAGNFYTLKDIRDRGINPLAFRYMVLSAHYRSKLNFTWEALEAAQNGLLNLYHAFGEIAREASQEETAVVTGNALQLMQKFDTALSDDLNVPQALAVMWEVVKSKDLASKEKRALIGIFDSVLGLDIEKATSPSTTLAIPQEVRDLVAQREQARSNKQFMQSDELRDKIERLGYIVQDSPEGPVIRPK